MNVGALIDSYHGSVPAANARCFACEWEGCDRSFARKSDLVRHFRIHTGVKPFACPWADCDKRFIQRSALKVHFRTHSGERPHTCETCDRSFSDSSSLARHRRTHTGVRPYGCEHAGCNKRFTRKTSLRKHMTTHDPSHIRRRTSVPSSSESTLSRSPTLSPVQETYAQLLPSKSFALTQSPTSSISTACNSPTMQGAEGISLPPIRSLLDY